MTHHRTQVCIVGAGPAGLLLAQRLHLEGIESIVLENRDREYVIERVRAGVLEQGTVDLIRELGVAARLEAEGMRHGGVYLAFHGERHHVDFLALTGGRGITVYGQNEVVKDLLGARDATGRPLLFEVADVALHDLETERPRVRFRHRGEDHEIACDVVAGCDGFHGICRPSMPTAVLRVYERTYPYAWLGILAEAGPTCPELVYSLHERGFALFSMRSQRVTRLYLQCAPDEDLTQWPDDRIWEELLARLRTRDGWEPATGPILQKGVTPMRSFVAEPMQFGRLFLAGDSAHIVPPTGAKGLNLAAADVHRLGQALVTFFRRGREEELRTYTEHCLRRVWRAQRFSAWMTATLHRPEGGVAFDHRLQLAELDHLVHSPAALTAFAQNYAGTPFH